MLLELVAEIAATRRPTSIDRLHRAAACARRQLPMGVPPFGGRQAEPVARLAEHGSQFLSEQNGCFNLDFSDRDAFDIEAEGQSEVPAEIDQLAGVGKTLQVGVSQRVA